MPNFNCAFNIFIKSTAEENILPVAMILSYILQEYYLNRSCVFLTTTTDMHFSTTWNIPKRFEVPSRCKISPVRFASISDDRTLIQNSGVLA
jgi:hypothetical protein